MSRILNPPPLRWAAGLLALVLLVPVGTLFAQADGSLRWAFAVGSSAESSAAVGADGLVYVGAQIRTTPPAGKLWAIDRDGIRRWEFTTPDWIDSTPVVGADGTIYVGCWDGKLYALGTDGKKRWEYNTGGFVFSSPALGPDGTIYLGGGDALLRAITPEGRTKWTFAAGDWVETPSVGADGTIYVGSWDRNLYAISPTGVEKWRFRTGSEISSSPGIASDGTIYITSDDGALYALLPDGRLRWTFQTGGALSTSPVTGADGTIYFGSMDRSFYAVNPDGSLKWKVPTPKGVQSSAAVRADGTIIFGGDDGSIRALNPDGSQRWVRSTGDLVLASPVVASDGTVYVGSYDGRLYAINGSGAGLSEVASWPARGRDLRRSSSSGPARVGRLRNLAVRADAGPGRNLVLGWSIAGRQPRRVLVRGVGPGLAAFGVAGFMPDPRLQLRTPAGVLIRDNDDWDTGQDPADLEAGALATGAFSLARGSRDAAVVLDLPPGNCSAAVEAGGGAGGVALIEAYDAAAAAVDSRLVNLSTLGRVGTGEAVLIPGLVIGEGRTRVLIRAVGPGLASFGVRDLLAQPTVTVRAGETVIARNTGWANGPNRADLEAAARLCGAFALDPASADCALFLTLDQGVHSLVVAGAGGGTGHALVEVYTLD